MDIDSILERKSRVLVEEPTAKVCKASKQNRSSTSALLIYYSV